MEATVSIIFYLPILFIDNKNKTEQIINLKFISVGFYSDTDWDDGKSCSKMRKKYFYSNKTINSYFPGIAVVGPPSKRPNKDPMPSHRPTPEQYAAMMAAAAAAGQPLPRHHVN